MPKGVFTKTPPKNTEEYYRYHWERYKEHFKKLKEAKYKDDTKKYVIDDDRIIKEYSKFKAKFIASKELKAPEGASEEVKRRINSFKHNLVREMAAQTKITSTKQANAFVEARKRIIQKVAEENAVIDVSKIEADVVARAQKKGQVLDEKEIKKRVARKAKKEMKEFIDKYELRTFDDKPSVAQKALSMSEEEFRRRLYKDKEFRDEFVSAVAEEMDYYTKRGERHILRSITPIMSPK